MIDERNVVYLTVPYPEASSALSKIAHMYICAEKVSATKRLVKCQSYKFGVIGQTSKYLIEQPDISRNPFDRITLIDCGKLFVTADAIPKNRLHKTRPDICAELHDAIKATLGNPVKVKFHIYAAR
ncbi:MAG: hypothetical protein LBT26_11510 [Clostridiales Family XIII bacterium]|nr:hypothetical protein [Clostridiales Family XIII bacterium]